MGAVDKGHLLQWVHAETMERLAKDDPQHRKTTSVSGVPHPVPQPQRGPVAQPPCFLAPTKCARYSHPASQPASQPPSNPVSSSQPARQQPPIPQKRDDEFAQRRRQTELREASERLRKRRADLDAQEEALVARLAEVAKDMAALKLEEDRAHKMKGT
ncbi:hypothetical protein N7478_008429 [Penicillium angulare]|uniref:uncharacterized protein n=1 Tax=Penicillium angulare TaxID=116970 RepID=UPI00254107EF|nr:uncharacterized protein N7478_008429 [Penicillium angulare]KAJ5273304.1 hypothetical protein N7478_008429 [Penicillium angulare]